MKAILFSLILTAFVSPQIANAGMGDWGRAVTNEVALAADLQVIHKSDIYANICGRPNLYRLLISTDSGDAYALNINEINPANSAGTKLRVKLLDVATCRYHSVVIRAID